MKLAVELTSRILISWPSRWYRSKVNGYLQLVITLIWLNPHHQQLSKKKQEKSKTSPSRKQCSCPPFEIVVDQCMKHATHYEILRLQGETASEPCEPLRKPRNIQRWGWQAVSNGSDNPELFLNCASKCHWVFRWHANCDETSTAPRGVAIRLKDCLE